MNQQHNNRRSQQDRKGTGKIKHHDPRLNKQKAGTELIMSDQQIAGQDYTLGWFKPTVGQKDIIISMCQKPLTVIQAPSGTGKSTTAIWQGLQDLRKGEFDRILFIKTPDESGDDQIGFLTGDSSQKLEVHFESMRSIFHSFMSKEKLRMEEKRDKIKFAIPNFIKGMTFDNTLILIDESQSMSPSTIKLLLERAGENTKVVLMGDKAQCYSVKRRVNGFTDFIKKVTAEDEEGKYSVQELIGYVELSTEDNMRSPLSKLITELYEE